MSFPTGFIPDVPRLSGAIRTGLNTPATNHVGNPSLETNTTGWIIAGSPTFAQDATQFLFGSKSLKITWPTAGANASTVNINITGLIIGQVYTFSVYLFVPTGSSDVKPGVVAAGYGPVVTIRDGWIRSFLTWTAAATTQSVFVTGAVATTAGQVCYADGFQVVKGSALLPYFDGDTPGCAWVGTAHASKSLRLGGEVNVPAASDDFSDPDGTLLTAHTASGGGSWTRSALASNNTIAPTIAAGRIYGENAATASLYYHSIVPSSPDYDVEADVIMRADNNLSVMGVVGRAVAGANTYYSAVYSTAANNWQLTGIQTGTVLFTTVQVGQILTVDQPYHVMLRLRGATISMYVNGVLLASVENATLAAAGVAGIRTSGAASATTGVHLDNWAVTPVLLGRPPFPSDTFTDTDAKTLETHVASDGGTWTKSSGSGAGSATIDANRVHNTNDATLHIYRHSYVPPITDYRVEVDLVMLSDNDLSYAGIGARISSTANTLYSFVYRCDANLWRLEAIVNGASTAIIGSVGQVLTVGQTYRIALDVRGSTVTAFVDGVQIASGTDTAIPAAGFAGIRLFNAAAAGVGAHLDNWTVIPYALGQQRSASDDFTDTNGVALTTHNANWIKHPAATNTASPVINNNRVHNENASTVSVYYRNDWVMPSPDYAVRAAVVKRSVAAGFGAGVIGRCDPTVATYYMWRYQTTTNTWQLYKIVAGTPTLLAGPVQALTVDQEYIAELSMVGSQITGKVDGVVLTTIVDTAISAKGYTGIRLEGLSTATSGIHLDTWSVNGF